MSCNYADGLSDYKHKGILGVPEVFDEEEDVNEKCEKLAKMILKSKHTVFHTGAGISTSAGIPDFRGPNGVWTCEKKGIKPTINTSFDEAIPTKTHQAIKALIAAGHIQYVISQNIDGLHLKSGISRKYLAEVHGNMFVEQCNKCRRQYVRSTPCTTVGQKLTGGICKGGKGARPCRGGHLIDNILDWEHDLPDKDIDLGFMHSAIADLNVCLGTTLQIIPSGNLPLKNKKFGGELVICNLQPTKHNKKADLIISSYVDKIMTKVMKKLGIEIPDYNREEDVTKDLATEVEWTIQSENIKEVEKIYDAKTKDFSKKRKSTISIPDERKSIKLIKKEKKN